MENKREIFEEAVRAIMPMFGDAPYTWSTTRLPTRSPSENGSVPKVALLFTTVARNTHWPRLLLVSVAALYPVIHARRLETAEILRSA